MVEARISRKVFKNINATFITIILNVDFLDSFEGLCPISLYNYLYKIVAMDLATKIKPLLSNFISMDKFGFSKGRHIS